LPNGVNLGTRPASDVLAHGYRYPSKNDKTRNKILTSKDFSKNPNKPSFLGQLLTLLETGQFSINGFGSSESGSKADPKKITYQVGTDITTVFTIWGIGETKRAEIPFVAVDLANTVVESSSTENKENKKTYINRNIDLGPATHGVLRNSDGTWRQYDGAPGPDTIPGKNNVDTIITTKVEEPTNPR
jgi:hypothetical protein